MDKTKFCKDCNYYNESKLTLPYCNNQKLGVSNVSGKVKIVHCVLTRSNDSLCGDEGKWFLIKEQKEHNEEPNLKPKTFWMKLKDIFKND